MIGHVFRDRDEAGAALADVMRDRVSGPVTVLAIPRGGVAVALPVARALGGAARRRDPAETRCARQPGARDRRGGARGDGAARARGTPARGARAEYIERGGCSAGGRDRAARGRLSRWPRAGAGRRPDGGRRRRRRGDRRHRRRRAPVGARGRRRPGRLRRPGRAAGRARPSRARGGRRGAPRGAARFPRGRRVVPGFRTGLG